MKNIKYLAIVDWAKKNIEERELSIGDKFYSENELCNIHDVSRQTVRQALAVLERDNVLMRKRGSGTFVRSSSFARTFDFTTVGVISTYFSDYIFPGIVTGIERTLSGRNMTMQLAITHNLVSEESRAIRAMLDRNVSGLIIEPSKSALPNPNTELYEEIKSRGIPTVFFNAKYGWSNSPCVAMDDSLASKTVTEYVISLGHKKISGIFISDDIQGHLRYRAFVSSCEASGIEMAEKRVLWYSTEEKGTLFSLSKERILTLLEDSTAIVCYNDELAVGLLEFCKNNNINVPANLSIVGIDDSRLARICDTPLTTVRHPMQRLGEKVVEVLFELMDNPDPFNNTVEDYYFTPKLIKRASTAKIK